LNLLKKIYRNLLFDRRWKRYKMLHPKMIYGVKHLGLLLPNTRISTSSVIHSPETLKLDDDVFIGHFNFIEASNGIEINRGTQITNYVSILSHSSHIAIRLYRENYRITTPSEGYITGPVIIGEYCFVGPHTTIMPNSVIGKGCLVQSHSLVKGVFPDFSIIAGVPAVVVGDTRDLDEKYLQNNDELKKSYSAWGKSED
jgi:acetyltransferase-like isoleucine patch superfamily enzyme